MDRDTFAHLSPILNKTEKGMVLSKNIQREIVEKELSPFFKDSRNIDKRLFEKSLRELEEIVPKSVVKEISRLTNANSKRFPHKVRIVELPKKTVSKIQKAFSKSSQISEEEIISKFNTRSGIRELRDLSSKNPKQKILFEKLKNEKILDILRGGKVRRASTGKDITNSLNNKKNYELMTELIGKEETETLLTLAEEIGEKETATALTGRIAKRSLKLLGKYKLLKFLLAAI
jgi:hypothetical protein